MPSRVPVYLLPGNHDPLDASSVYTSALFLAECPDNVTVLDRAGVHEVRPGLEIVAAPWRSKAPTIDLVGDVLDGLPADGVTRIVVGHGGVDVFEPDRDKVSLIRLAAVEAALARGAVHYVALGDKHSRTEVGTTGRVWYSGAPEVTNYDHIESDPGHVLVVDIDERDAQRAVRVDARKVGRWRFVSMRFTVDNSRDITDLGLNLDLMPDKDRTVVQLALTGIADRHRQGRAGRVHRQAHPALRGIDVVGQPDRRRRGARRRRVRRSRHRGIRRRGGRRVGGHRTRRR